MADSSDCRCVSDDGSCPHESFTKAKFQIYWHEIEHDIDNVLANYTRESIRDFIEIEKLKSVRTMSSLVNRLSRPNPDKNINKLRKVYGQDLRKMFSDKKILETEQINERIGTAETTRPSTSMSALSYQSSKKSGKLPRLNNALSGKGIAGLSTKSISNQVDIDTNATDRPKTGYSTTSLPPIGQQSIFSQDDALSSSILLGSASISSQKVDGKYIKDSLRLSSRKTLARSLFGLPIDVSKSVDSLTDRSIPKNAWISSLPNPLAHSLPAQSIIDTLSIVSSETIHASTLLDSSISSINQNFVDLLSIVDIVVSNTLPWNAMHCPKALEHTNLIHNTINAQEHFEPFMLDLSKQISDNIQDFICEKQVEVDKFLEQMNKDWKDCLEQLQKELNQCIETESNRVAYRKRQNIVDKKRRDIEFLNILDQHESKYAADIMIEHQRNWNTYTNLAISMGDDRDNANDTGNHVSLRRESLGIMENASMIDEVNVSSLEQQIKLRTNIRRREMAHESLCAMGNTAIAKMISDEQIALQSDRLSSQIDLIVSSCNSFVLKLKEDFDLIQVSIDEFSNRSRQYAMDFIFRELCINQAFERVILAKINAQNTARPGTAANRLIKLPALGNNLTVSTIGPLLPSSMTETRMTITQWETKFVKDRYLKKNKQLYTTHNQRLKSGLDTIISKCHDKIREAHNILIKKIEQMKKQKSKESEKRKVLVNKELFEHVSNFFGERDVSQCDNVRERDDDESRISVYFSFITDIRFAMNEIHAKHMQQRQELQISHNERMTKLKEKVMELFKKLILDTSLIFPTNQGDKDLSPGRGSDDSWATKQDALLNKLSEREFSLLQSNVSSFQRDSIQKEIDQAIRSVNISHYIDREVTDDNKSNTIVKAVINGSVSAAESNSNDSFARDSHDVITKYHDIDSIEAQDIFNNLISPIHSIVHSNDLNTLAITSSDRNLNSLRTDLNSFRNKISHWKTLIETFEDDQLSLLCSQYQHYLDNLSSSFCHHLTGLDNGLKKQLMSMNEVEKEIQDQIANNILLYEIQDDLFEQRTCKELHEFWMKWHKKLDDQFIFAEAVQGASSPCPESQDILENAESCSNATESHLDTDQDNAIASHLFSNMSTPEGADNAISEDRKDDNVKGSRSDRGGGQEVVNLLNEKVYHSYYQKIHYGFETLILEINQNKSKKSKRSLPGNLCLKVLLSASEWLWNEIDITHQLPRLWQQIIDSLDGHPSNLTPLSLFCIGSSLQILSRIKECADRADDIQALRSSYDSPYGLMSVDMILEAVSSLNQLKQAVKIGIDLSLSYININEYNFSDDRAIQWHSMLYREIQWTYRLFDLKLLSTIEESHHFDGSSTTPCDIVNEILQLSSEEIPSGRETESYQPMSLIVSLAQTSLSHIDLQVLLAVLGRGNGYIKISRSHLYEAISLWRQTAKCMVESLVSSNDYYPTLRDLLPSQLDSNLKPSNNIEKSTSDLQSARASYMSSFDKSGPVENDVRCISPFTAISRHVEYLTNIPYVPLSPLQALCMLSKDTSICDPWLEDVHTIARNASVFMNELKMFLNILSKPLHTQQNKAEILQKLQNDCLIPPTVVQFSIALEKELESFNISKSEQVPLELLRSYILPSESSNLSSSQISIIYWSFVRFKLQEGPLDNRHFFAVHPVDKGTDLNRNQTTTNLIEAEGLSYNACEGYMNQFSDDMALALSSSSHLNTQSVLGLIHDIPTPSTAMALVTDALSLQRKGNKPARRKILNTIWSCHHESSILNALNVFDISSSIQQARSLGDVDEHVKCVNKGAIELNLIVHYGELYDQIATVFDCQETRPNTPSSRINAQQTSNEVNSSIAWKEFTRHRHRRLVKYMHCEQSFMMNDWGKYLHFTRSNRYRIRCKQVKDILSSYKPIKTHLQNDIISNRSQLIAQYKRLYSEGYQARQSECVQYLKCQSKILSNQLDYALTLSNYVISCLVYPKIELYHRRSSHLEGYFMENMNSKKSEYISSLLKVKANCYDEFKDNISSTTVAIVSKQRENLSNTFQGLWKEIFVMKEQFKESKSVLGMSLLHDIRNILPHRPEVVLRDEYSATGDVSEATTRKGKRVVKSNRSANKIPVDKTSLKQLGLPTRRQSIGFNYFGLGLSTIEEDSKSHASIGSIAGSHIASQNDIDNKSLNSTNQRETGGEQGQNSVVTDTAQDTSSIESELAKEVRKSLVPVLPPSPFKESSKASVKNNPTPLKSQVTSKSIGHAEGKDSSFDLYRGMSGGWSEYDNNSHASASIISNLSSGVSMKIKDGMNDQESRSNLMANQIEAASMAGDSSAQSHQKQIEQRSPMIDSLLSTPATRSPLDRQYSNWTRDTKSFSRQTSTSSMSTYSMDETEATDDFTVQSNTSDSVSMMSNIYRNGTKQVIYKPNIDSTVPESVRVSLSAQAIEENMNPSQLYDYLLNASYQLHANVTKMRYYHSTIHVKISDKIAVAYRKLIRDIVTFYKIVACDEPTLLKSIANESKTRLFEAKKQCEIFLEAYYRQFHDNITHLYDKYVHHETKIHRIIKSILQRWENTRNLCVSIIDHYINEILQDMTLMKMKCYQLIENFRENHLQTLIQMNELNFEKMFDEFYKFTSFDAISKTKTVILEDREAQIPSKRYITSTSHEIHEKKIPKKRIQDKNNTKRVDMPLNVNIDDEMWYGLLRSYQRDVDSMKNKYEMVWNMILQTFNDEQTNINLSEGQEAIKSFDAVRNGVNKQIKCLQESQMTRKSSNVSELLKKHDKNIAEKGQNSESKAPNTMKKSEIVHGKDMSQVIVKYPLLHYQALFDSIPSAYTHAKDRQINAFIVESESKETSDIFVRPQVESVLNFIISGVEAAASIESNYQGLIDDVESKTTESIKDIELFTSKYSISTEVIHDKIAIIPKDSSQESDFELPDLKAVHQAATIVDHRHKEMKILIQSIENHLETDKSKFEVLIQTSRKYVEDWYFQQLLDLNQLFADAEDKYASGKLPIRELSEDGGKIVFPVYEIDSIPESDAIDAEDKDDEAEEEDVEEVKSVALEIMDLNQPKNVDHSKDINKKKRKKRIQEKTSKDKMNSSVAKLLELVEKSKNDNETILGSISLSNDTEKDSNARWPSFMEQSEMDEILSRDYYPPTDSQSMASDEFFMAKRSESKPTTRASSKKRLMSGRSRSDQDMDGSDDLPSDNDSDSDDMSYEEESRGSRIPSAHRPRITHNESKFSTAESYYYDSNALSPASSCPSTCSSDYSPRLSAQSSPRYKTSRRGTQEFIADLVETSETNEIKKRYAKESHRHRVTNVINAHVTAHITQLNSMNEGSTERKSSIISSQDYDGKISPAILSPANYSKTPESTKGYDSSSNGKAASFLSVTPKSFRPTSPGGKQDPIDVISPSKPAPSSKALKSPSSGSNIEESGKFFGDRVDVTIPTISSSGDMLTSKEDASVTVISPCTPSRSASKAGIASARPRPLSLRSPKAYTPLGAPKSNRFADKATPKSALTSPKKRSDSKEVLFAASTSPRGMKVGLPNALIQSASQKSKGKLNLLKSPSPSSARYIQNRGFGGSKSNVISPLNSKDGKENGEEIYVSPLASALNESCKSSRKSSLRDSPRRLSNATDAGAYIDQSSKTKHNDDISPKALDSTKIDASDQDVRPTMSEQNPVEIERDDGQISDSNVSSRDILAPDNRDDVQEVTRASIDYEVDTNPPTFIISKSLEYIEAVENNMPIFQPTSLSVESSLSVTIYTNNDATDSVLSPENDGDESTSPGTGTRSSDSTISDSKYSESRITTAN